MSLSLVDHFKISETTFAATGALDPILDIDTQLSIDPALLRVTTIDELKPSYDRVVDHFTSVLRIVQNIETPNKTDRFWRQADKLLTFPEATGLSIGYATKSANGRGMGPKIRAQLLESVWKIVRAGTFDATIFELVGIFEENVGPDRISDMIAKIIIADLVSFTQRASSVCGIPMQPHRVPLTHTEEDLPTHPHKGTPIILVPREVLKDLPLAMTFGDIAFVAEHNEKLRNDLNRLIGFAWRELSESEKKRKRKDIFLDRPDVFAEVIKAYQQQHAERYDFAKDPAGKVIWYPIAREVAKNFPLELDLSASPTLMEVESVVLKICEQFKHLVEDGQIARLLYNEDGTARHEEAAQMVFYCIAFSHCIANNLDLTPEADAGRGPVDFKVSKGADAKVVVELKLTSNKNLQHGFEEQLPIYKRAEQAQRGVYLVVNNGGISVPRLFNFRACVRDAKSSTLKVLMVDGSIRPSASKKQVTRLSHLN